MRVLAVDIQALQPPPTVDELYPLDQLHDVLPMLDVLVVAVPLTERTRVLIGAAELALLKPSAYFFVISRGGILDEGALVSALRENRLAGAGLDVTATEPLPPDSPLWELDNLIISPHVSALGPDDRSDVADHQGEHRALHQRRAAHQHRRQATRLLADSPQHRLNRRPGAARRRTFRDDCARFLPASAEALARILAEGTASSTSRTSWSPAS